VSERSRLSALAGAALVIRTCEAFAIGLIHTGTPNASALPVASARVNVTSTGGASSSSAARLHLETNAVEAFDPARVGAIEQMRLDL
jgi:hypothetical protein